MLKVTKIMIQKGLLQKQAPLEVTKKEENKK
jgi:hypothetical protein